MNKREPLQTEDFFKRRLSYIDAAINERNAILQERPPRPQIGLYANFQDRYEQLFIGYSLNESVEQLARRFPIVVESYEKYEQDEKATPTELGDLDEYIIALWLISLALIFKVDDSLWNRLLACIGNEGKDALYEALVATRTPNREPASGLLHSKTFEPLFSAISAKGESRDAFVKRYLKDWYEGRKRAYFYNTHGRNDGGFFGYWAVEVAGVVAAFNMDDSAFRDMAFYPKDLVA